jgi:anhydro-N-acetylmuramic acid kinase
MRNEWNGLGVMSGTSLDGIDLAWCHFSQNRDMTWDYSIEYAVTLPYSYYFRERLANAPYLSALEYVKLNNDVAEVMSAGINDWLSDKPKPDYIASHGHTVFHQPDIGLTTQIGNGAVIAARTGIMTICDFRTMDVALGGQGAPLVPIGDELLFGDYDACLNLGGISNISYRTDEKRVAYDISPCNMALNELAYLAGLPYDIDGQLSRNGQVIPKLLAMLNGLDYYQQPAPKSLGKEWYENVFRPVLEPFMEKHQIHDVARTVVEHIAKQIVANVPKNAQSMLVTGGGAHHTFLIQQIQNQRDTLDVIVPDDLIVNYKEALIFAFLGLLRIHCEENCLRSVTGARIDSCGGCIYFR